MLMGPRTQPILEAGGDLAIAVNATATVYSKAIDLSHGETFAMIIDAASGGAVGLDIDIEQSDVLPATEGSADGNYVTPEGVSTFLQFAAVGRKIKAYAPVVARYMRLKITGTGANAATTTVTAKLSMTESD